MRLPSNQPEQENRKKKKSCLKILSPILSPPSHDRLVCVYTAVGGADAVVYVVVVVVAILELDTHCAWAVCIYHSARYRWGNLKADEVVFAVRNSAAARTDSIFV